MAAPGTRQEGVRLEPWLEEKYSDCNPWRQFNPFYHWFLYELDHTKFRALAATYGALTMDNVRISLRQLDGDRVKHQEKAYDLLLPGYLRSFWKFLDLLGDSVYEGTNSDIRKNLVKLLPEELQESYRGQATSEEVKSKPVERPVERVMPEPWKNKQYSRFDPWSEPKFGTECYGTFLALDPGNFRKAAVQHQLLTAGDVQELASVGRRSEHQSEVLGIVRAGTLRTYWRLLLTLEDSKVYNGSNEQLVQCLLSVLPAELARCYTETRSL